MTAATSPAATESSDTPEMGVDEMITKFLRNGRTMRDFTALTPESMEVIYSMAYTLYNAAKFREAEKIFKLLANLEHFERKYWKGLGAAREGLKNYKGALLVYGHLGAMDVNDPYPAFQAAKCFMALDKAGEAKAALRAAVFNSTNQPDHAALHESAKTLLELLENAAQPTTTPATPAQS
jgi:type III secretion system low calcium response chaperone LcrH/SycD